MQSQMLFKFAPNCSRLADVNSGTFFKRKTHQTTMLTSTSNPIKQWLSLICGFSEEWIDMKDIPLLEDKFR